MKTLLKNSLLTLALALAGLPLSNTAEADESGVNLRSVTDSLSDPNFHVADRYWRWNSRGYYMRPYWDGGSYYYNPPVYYRRIAPGVYYYF